MKQTLVINGASDDLIEIGGALRDEFTYVEDEANHIAFSDGTVLAIKYDDSGCWRISPTRYGTATYSKVEAEGADSDNYSDRVTLTGEFKWVMHGTNFSIVAQPQAD